MQEVALGQGWDRGRETALFVNKDGAVQNLSANNMTAPAGCLFLNLMQTGRKKEEGRVFPKAASTR
jgi:hypothetical protein